jgi:diacylglycerol kinase
MPSPSLDSDLPERLATRKRKSWKQKFGVAFRGWKLGIRGQSSFFVHFFFTVLALTAAIVLRCEVLEWCLLFGCIGLVLTAELVNSAIETLFRGLDPAAQDRVWPCLDISAGAVLMASVTAAIIGTLLFGWKLISLLKLGT